MREAAAAQRDRGCHDAPPRADGQAHRGRDERRGEREVRQVAGGEMDREQPGEEPGEHPRRACPAAFAGHGARGTDEHGRPHADRGPERRLEGGGDGRHGQVRRAGEDGQERGAARPLTDDREPLRRAHPCPPQVDGDVGADTEPVPVPDERREQHAEHDERQPREPREVAAGARAAARVRRSPRGAERALSVDDERAVVVRDAGTRERPVERGRLGGRHGHVARPVSGRERGRSGRRVDGERESQRRRGRLGCR